MSESELPAFGRRRNQGQDNLAAVKLPQLAAMAPIAQPATLAVANTPMSPSTASIVNGPWLRRRQ
jgi:hypothetical protein